MTKATIDTVAAHTSMADTERWETNSTAFAERAQRTYTRMLADYCAICPYRRNAHTGGCLQNECPLKDVSNELGRLVRRIHFAANLVKSNQKRNAQIKG